MGVESLEFDDLCFFLFAALFFFVFFAPPQAVHVVNCRKLCMYVANCRKKARDGPVVSKGVSKGLQKEDQAQTE